MWSCARSIATRCYVSQPRSFEREWRLSGWLVSHRQRGCKERSSHEPRWLRRGMPWECWIRWQGLIGTRVTPGHIVGRGP